MNYSSTTARAYTYKVITWIAVALRLWVRFRVMREPGWDDALVILALALNTAATIFVLICECAHKLNLHSLTDISAINYGLGQHFLYLGVPKMTTYIKVGLTPGR